MKKQWRHRIPFWISAIILSVGLLWTYKTLHHFCEKRTDGFSIEAISSHREDNPAWNVHTLSNEEEAELNQALTQSYHYLACGNQAFAFLSEDGRYVLKFFKQKLYEPLFFWKWIPSTWLKEGRRAKKLWKKQDKLQRDYESYRLAFDELKEQTGLIFVHLNTTNWLNNKLKVIDKSQAVHFIDLDQFNFIIQKRADLVYPTIDTLMAQSNISAAKQALSSILRLFAARCQKGIADSDPDLDKNFGFIDGKAVQIDIGRFTRNPEKIKFQQRHLTSRPQAVNFEPPVIKENFQAWLKENYPELHDHFMGEYQTLCNDGAFIPQRESLTVQ